MNEIKCTNIIYVKDISKLGGVESFVWYMIRKYHNLDIMVLCRSIDTKQMARIQKYCPVVVHRGQKIYCKTLIINYDTSILDFLEERQRIHGSTWRLYNKPLQSISKL